jgi:hypothetical protein
MVPSLRQTIVSIEAKYQKDKTFAPLSHGATKPQIKHLTAETAEGRRDTQEKQRRGFDFSPTTPLRNFVSFVVQGICAGKQEFGAW